MDLSKVYTVLFNEGSAGTFLIWFVSQHNDFLQLRKSYLSEYRSTIDNKYYPVQNSVRHMILSIPSFELNNTLLDRYLKVNFKKASPGAKIIFKTLPHACPVVAESIIDRNRSFPNINVIILVVENWDWVTSRLSSLKPNYDEIAEKKIFQVEYITEKKIYIQEYFKTNGINYCEISIDKILNLDTDEYNKLLGFIGSNAIPNWQDLIIDYKKNVGLSGV